MNRSNKAKMFAIALLSVMLAAGCSAEPAATASSAASAAVAGATSASSSASAAETAGVETVSLDAAKQANFKAKDEQIEWSQAESTAITLSDAGASVAGAGAAAEGGIVTITAAGTYVVAGSITSGQIVVDAPKDALVHIVLNGARITNSVGPAMHIKQSDKTIVTLQDGTDNAVSDGTAYADTSEDAAVGAIFSKSDLTINGTGKLTVIGQKSDGLVSKDDLKIISGTIDVQAADDGIIGRDLFAVKDGVITIQAGGDGIKTTNDTAADKGIVAITGGTFTITSANDGIQAESSMAISGGTFNIVAGGGSAASAKAHQEEQPRGFGDRASMQQQPQAQADSADTPSAKALKAKGAIAIADGTFQIDAADDAIHSNNSIAIAGGQYSLATGDDAIHADKTVSISNGTIDIAKSYEGIEGTNIDIAGGSIHLVSQDDGVNVSGGDSQPAGGGRGEPGATNGKLTISGGYLYVDAAGDGLDSNGSIAMTGGTVIVDGPTDNGNGALDYDGTFEQSGGTLIAAGSAGMAQAPSDSSTQRAVHMTFPSTLQAGTLVTLTDSSGKTVTAFAPAKSFGSIVISTPELKAGEAYTISTGGSSSGKATDGLYDDGAVSGGTKIVTFTLGDKVTYVNQSGITTAKTGGPGGGFGGGPGGGRGPGGGGAGGGGPQPQ
ncbi:carbohydrate-binding domain-containing protein [Paenibacillus thalictri]|uniref:Carbohydrate-binding domain-containing protein n=1 Tax=Paenibacillus thalictri TaxID=2527873 RepID=A0A4Q9DI12_9BACL|nr:carbohydrate-binding domain-containing protein [Paenibacillus thalictri]TBL70716.1 carbohydrate-binding domain-containing protein [Paenibacillus thalictri]